MNVELLDANTDRMKSPALRTLVDDLRQEIGRMLRAATTDDNKINALKGERSRLKEHNKRLETKNETQRRSILSYQQDIAGNGNRTNKMLEADNARQAETIQRLMTEANGYENRLDSLAKRNRELDEIRRDLKQDIRGHLSAIRDLEGQQLDKTRLTNQISVLKRIIHVAGVCPLLAIDEIFGDSGDYFTGAMA